ncbi:hypothetical protein [Bartonella sp. CB74]|uniref:hypothetical protein n=1 Tax=Bartonella sp. CB74 TaxID=3113620 RepID=UPI002F961AD8
MLIFEYADILRSICDADTLAAVGSILAALFTGGYLVSWELWRRRERKKEELGERLKISSCRLYEYTKDEKDGSAYFHVDLTIYHPKEQLININYIEFPSDSPFLFSELAHEKDDGTLKEVGISDDVNKLSNRIDFRNPINEMFPVNFSCMFSQEELKLWFLVYVKNEKELTQFHPIFITLEHTSSNDPRETLKVIFPLGFIKRVGKEKIVALGSEGRASYESKTRLLLIE